MPLLTVTLQLSYRPPSGTGRLL